ncbi:MAG: ATP synthase F1 subunit delta [Candidatus Omnitrophota bacterium]
MKKLPVRSYTQMLLELSKEQNSLETVAGDMVALKSLIGDSKEFDDFLNNPSISSSVRQGMVEELFKTRVHATTFQFLNFLSEKGRLPLLFDICLLFEGKYKDIKGIVDVTIFTSFESNTAEIKDICRQLKEKLHKDIEPKVVVDRHLLGGIKIKVKDFVYDLSLRNQLVKFQKGIFTA